MDLNHARLPIPPLRHLECTAYKQSSANERNDIIILPKIRQLTGPFSTALYRQQPMRQGQLRLQGQPVKTPLVSLRGSGPRERSAKRWWRSVRGGSKTIALSSTNSTGSFKT